MPQSTNSLASKQQGIPLDTPIRASRTDDIATHHGHRRSKSFSLPTHESVDRNQLLRSHRTRPHHVVPRQPETAITHFDACGRTVNHASLFDSTASTCLISSQIGEFFVPTPQDELPYTAFEARKGEMQRVAEDSFLEKNQALMSALRTPNMRSISHNEEVIDKVAQHALRNDNPIFKNRDFVKDLIVIGENVARAIFSQSIDNTDPSKKYESPIIKCGEENISVPSELFLIRGLSLYMMAVTAAQDLERAKQGDHATSDMTTSGLFIMKDPGNRVFKYLAAYENAVDRMSTHLPDRLGHDNYYYILGFISTGGTKRVQKGIEDYRSLLPFPSGSILFDHLKPGKDGVPELFIKFEAEGCPGVYDKDSENSWLATVDTAGASISRQVAHGASYFKSKNQKSAAESNEILRQEHVKKGVLKPVYDDFVEFKQTPAFAEFLNSTKNPKPENSGITKMRDALSGFMAQESTEAAVKAAAETLHQTIVSEMARLGRASDHYNIERNGAEVHVTLDPTEVPGTRVLASTYALSVGAPFNSVGSSQFDDGMSFFDDSASLFESGQWSRAPFTVDAPLSQSWGSNLWQSSGHFPGGTQARLSLHDPFNGQGFGLQGAGIGTSPLSSEDSASNSTTRSESLISTSTVQDISDRGSYSSSSSSASGSIGTRSVSSLSNPHLEVEYAGSDLTQLWSADSTIQLSQGAWSSQVSNPNPSLQRVESVRSGQSPSLARVVTNDDEASQVASSALAGGIPSAMEILQGPEDLESWYTPSVASRRHSVAMSAPGLTASPFAPLPTTAPSNAGPMAAVTGAPTEPVDEPAASTLKAAPTVNQDAPTQTNASTREAERKARELEAQAEVDEFLDWSAFKIDWSEMFDFSWLRKLAFWR